MGQAEYKLERFTEPDFPVYASVQSGREELVKIHYHVSSAELMQVLEGKIRLLVGTTYCECSKGDIIFIPPSVVHQVTSLTEDATIRGISYELSLLKIEGLKMDFSELFHRSQSLQYIVTSEAKEHGVLCAYISNIFASYGNFSTVHKIQILSNLLLVMSRLIGMFQLEISTHDKNYKKLKPVLSYVEQNYMEKIQVSQLGKIIHVCDDRLIRLFKEVTGETPIEYIMNLRVEAAIKMLSSTDFSVADIADRTGFGSDTYMTRVFKQRLNTTPGKYRRKL